MKLGVGGWKFAGTAALLLALLWPGGAFAQEDDAFKRGLDAREKKNWNAAAMAMREAIANDAKESPRKIGGGLFRGGTEYVPHYFLGEALYNLNDCAGAVTEWALSDQQPVVGTVREFKAFMATGYRVCAMRGVLLPAEFNTLSAAASQEVKDAVGYAERVSKLGNGDAWRPELREQYSRIAPDLQTAQVKLAAGMRSRSAADFSDARAAAGRVVTTLKAFEIALNASIDNLTTVRRQLREVEQQIAGAEGSDHTIDALNTTLSPELSTSRQAGRDLLARARDQARVGERTQSLTTVNDALRSAQDAAAVFDQVLEAVRKVARDSVDRQVADAAAAASETLSFLDSSLATVAKLFTDKAALVTPDLESQRAALEKRVVAIRRRVETAQKSGNAPSLKEAARLASDTRVDLEKLVTAFGPLSLRDRGVQAALEDGARQFFAGEYQQAIATLDTASLADAPLQLHVHLFRAAALYHLFVRSGEKDQALRTRALAEIEACKRLNSQFAPDTRAFAPRFITFYQNAPQAAP
jgi:hypothetical protein